MIFLEIPQVQTGASLCQSILSLMIQLLSSVEPTSSCIHNIPPDNNLTNSSKKVFQLTDEDISDNIYKEFSADLIATYHDLLSDSLSWPPLEKLSQWIQGKDGSAKVS